MMKKILKYLYLAPTVVLLSVVAGCVDEDENLPQVISEFSFELNEDSGTITFENTSENADSYLWDFGDETSSTDDEPIKTYEEGTYVVSLTAFNVAGASDIFSDTITVVVNELVSLPITFDNTDTNYDAYVFEGASFEVVSNPDESGANNKSSNVGAIMNSGAELEGVSFDLGNDIDLETERSITMSFWSETPIDVLARLEEGDMDDIEATASHGGTGWEAITFDFESAGSYSIFTLFADASGTTEGTFYFDDVIQSATVDTTAPVITLIGPANITIIIGNDYVEQGATATDNIDGDISDDIVIDDSAVDTDTEGSYEVTYNVTDAAGNAAIEVIRTVTVATADTEKPIITLLGDNPLNLSVGDTYSEPGAMATDNVDGDISGSIIIDNSSVNTSVAGTYEVTYNVSDAAGNAADEVIREVIVTSTSVCINETSQSLAATDLNVTFQTDPGSFIGEDGVTYTYVDNPDFTSSTNRSCKVAQIERDPAFPFANNQFEFNSKFDFSSNSGFKLKVFAVGTGYTVTLKLEDKNDASINTEVQQTTTVGASEWEELTFDFPDTESGKYDKIVLFFDINTSSAGTYFLDDLRLYDGSGSGGGGSGDGELAINGDFETGDDTGWTIFDAGGGTFTVSTEQAETGNFSGKLVAAQAEEVLIKQANIAVGTINPNTNVTITFDLYGELTGAGGVVFAEFFSELSGGGVSSAEIFSGGPLTPTTTWTQYSFSTTTGSDVSGGITLQLKAACGDVSGCNVEAFFDNVSITID